MSELVQSIVLFDLGVVHRMMKTSSLFLSFARRLRWLLFVRTCFVVVVLEVICKKIERPAASASDHGHHAQTL